VCGHWSDARYSPNNPIRKVDSLVEILSVVPLLASSAIGRVRSSFTRRALGLP
jgi:hypothetical protein